MRTTCSLEAYNGVLNKNVVNKGHFFSFVHDMRNEEYIKREEFATFLESGAKTANYRRIEYRVNCLNFNVI